MALQGRGALHPTCLEKFLPFSKNVELLFDEGLFWPIIHKKACSCVRKQELQQGLKRYRPICCQHQKCLKKFEKNTDS